MTTTPESPGSKRILSLSEPIVLLLGSLILGVVFWSFDSADPMWGIISFILVYDPDDQIILSTAFKRVVFSVFGSLLALGVLFAFGDHKWALPAGIVLVSFVVSLTLKSRSARRIVLVTAALIIGSSLMNPAIATYIAVTRSVEVFAGSLLAIAFSWGVPRATSRLFPRSAVERAVNN